MLKDKHILLVEDNEMNRLLAATILHQFGARVSEAADGAIAIKQLEESDFDMVLMDIQMPVKDGIEATKYIRAHINSTIPILALTAHAFKEEEEKCLQAGMNDFITKPFDEEKMLQKIIFWLNRQAPDIPHQAVQAPDNSRLFDLNKLKAISRGDDEFIRKMLALFITTIPDTLRQMQEALEHKDWKTLGGLAHRIKPSLQSMGINSVSDSVLALEQHATEPIPEQSVAAKLHHVQQVLALVIEELKKIG